MVVLVGSTPSLIHHIMLHHHTLDVEVNNIRGFPQVYRIFLTFEKMLSFCTLNSVLNKANTYLGIFTCRGFPRMK